MNSFDLDAMSRALAGTPFAGRLNFLPTIHSTNTLAMDAARGTQDGDGAAHGTVYFADEQTAGRGRGDHSWHSAAGDGLYVSVVLREPFLMAQLHWLPLVAGLAAHRAIHEVTGLTADLRWPNDILIGERKTAGILVEAHSGGGSAGMSAAGHSPAYAVAGIGINVHQRAFPPDLRAAATSLDLEREGYVSRQALLVALLESLHAEAERLRPGAEGMAASGHSPIPGRIEAVSSWVRGRRVAVHGPQACEGVTEGLDERGFLRVRTEAGLVTVQTGGIRPQ